MTFLEGLYADVMGRGRAAQQRDVTERLIEEMHRQVSRHGAHFTVVFLERDSPAIAHYRAYLPQRGIDVLDCGGVTSGDQVVEGEGHPNGRMNAIWADCLARKLQDLVP